MRLAKTQLIYKTEAIHVYRGQCLDDGRPIIIKSLPDPTANAHQRARIRYEYDILCVLAEQQVPCVLQPVALHEEGGELALLSADISGESLRALGEVTLEEALHVTLEVCKALAAVHRLDITHKDINPDNIVFNRQSGAVQLIDFGIAARLPREAQPVANPGSIEGTPPYISPEQTGRMNRLLDYRSDFYSLGVTLFELLCGQRPFDTADVAQLVYSHLAVEAKHPSRLNSSIPKPLGDIVMKMLQKDPEHRYQSAAGLNHDLHIAAAALRDGQWPAAFEPGAQDHSEHFIVPQKLYGRDIERRTLIDLYDRVAQGRREILMVNGPSGIGKSVLINELQGVLLQRNGVFAGGKHDVLRRHVPFSALAQSIEQWVQRILLEPQSSFGLWQRRLNEAFGRLGQALVDIAPSLGLIVGPQPPLHPLGPQEAENRLALSLDRLLRVMCTEHPVVLFLDDLQWADAATLKFIGRWQNEASYQAGLLFIGAYRSDEVLQGHPLQLAASELARKGLNVPVIELQPMTPDDIGAMLREGTGSTEVIGLAQLIASKTGGNAFFVREFIRDLARKNLLRYNGASRVWIWDLRAIESLAITSNLVQFMNDKLDGLADEEKRLLGVASCSGRAFDVGDLASAVDLSFEATFAALQPALKAGFIMPVGKAWRYAGQGEAGAVLQFAHDKVQEAAVHLLSPEQRAQAHRHLGKRQLAQLTAESAEKDLFAAVDHLNQATSLLTAAERDDLAGWNKRAALHAQRATAFDIAADYWQRVLTAWESRQDEEYRMAALQMANCEALSGQRAAADARLALLLQTAPKADERAAIHGSRARCLVAMLKYVESTQASIAGLAELGYVLPPRPTMVTVIAALVQLQRSLRGRAIESLSDAPPIGDERIQRILEMLNDLAPASYFSNVTLYGMVVLRMGQLSLEHGNSYHSGFVFASLCAVYAAMGNYRVAQRYAVATRSLPTSHGGGSPRAVLAVEVTLGYASAHARDLTKLYLQAGTGCLAEGDVVDASNSIGMALVILQMIDLQEFVAEHRKYGTLIAQLNESYHTFNSYHRNFQRVLCGEGDKPNDFDIEDHYAAIVADEVAGLAPVMFLTQRVIMATLFRAFDMGIEAALLGIKRGVRSKVGENIPFFFDTFFAVLLTQDAAARGGRVRQRKELRRITKRLRKLARLDLTLPKGALCLIDAEVASLQGNNTVAAPLYDEAVRLLGVLGYTSLTGLACECAGRFHHRLGVTTAAEAYLREAVANYRNWGALHKMQQLLQEFTLPDEGQRRTKTTGTDTFSGRVDLPVLMRATQVLSGEVVLERLILRIVESTQEAAGATRAVLLLSAGEKDRLHPEVDSAGRPDTIAHEVVQYVARSLEAVVVDDAILDPRSSRDPYVQRYKPRSLLCAPLLHQGALRGAIYLENAITPKAFTVERLQLVKMLAAQAAVSLDNARVYAEMESKVTQRTAQLQEMHASLVAAQRDAAEMRMAGGFAHEMRNALTGARYALDAINEEYERNEPAMLREIENKLKRARQEGLSERAYAELSEVVGHCRHGLTLVREGLLRGTDVTAQILRYAEVGTLVPGADVLKVHDAVRAVAAEMAEAFAALTIRFECYVPPSAAIVGSRDHLATILRNLFSNARDALAAKGDASARTLRVRWETRPGHLVLLVEDSGIGMDDSVRHRIFEPFFSTKGRRGTGLGLGLSRKIAQLYGGDIEFHSQLGEGTTFCLMVPNPLGSMR